MSLVEVENVSEEVTLDADPPISDNANTRTVGYALGIVAPAQLALQDLGIPNNIGEEHRDILVELQNSVADLEQKLIAAQEENRLLLDDDPQLRDTIDQVLPLWKRAWEEFILKAAGGIGDSAGKGTTFAAGFVAGMLYAQMSQAGLGISV